MTRILYLGLMHRPNDPRLCHREMRVILESDPNSEIFFIQWEHYQSLSQPQVIAEKLKYGPIEFTRVICCFPMRKPGLNRFEKKREKLRRVEFVVKQGTLLRPDTVQVSDVREIKVGLLISRRSECKVVYDSHEDYVRQILDYADRVTVRRWIEAFKIWLKEVRKIRHFDAVFCADDYLYRKYRKLLYGAPRVGLLRNFPYETFWQEQTRLFEEKNILDLVYIGGVNRSRGVIECAEFCERFNRETDGGKSLRFTVYGPKNRIVEDLQKRALVRHFEWIDYLGLMQELHNYDVGVCLWHPIPKFYRNLPLKNFDYMAAGLPVLTSNFGNLFEYLEESDAGIGINPTSYGEFKEAIRQLFDPSIRRKFAENGQRWVHQSGNFKRESKEYVKTMLSG